MTDMTEMKSTFNKISETNLATIKQIMDKFLRAADVKAVYGDPILHGEAMIIPAAEVISGLGFGLGSGGGEAPRVADQETSSGGGSGGGGGGGGRVFSRPVAVVIADQNGVRVEPVVDPTKIALAFFTTLGFMAAMARKMSRNKPGL